MENLVKYDSDEELKETGGGEVKAAADLESEWADFEKMISGGGGDDEEKGSPTGLPDKSASCSPEQTSTNTATAIHNPYAYLSQYAGTSSASNGDGTSNEDMEKHLEAFLEQAMNAASAAGIDVNKTEEDYQSDSGGSGSESDDQDGSHSDHSASDREKSKEKSLEPKEDEKTEVTGDNTVEAKPDDKPRRTGSPSRCSRSKRSRSRSRSRRSRSGSRSRGHRHRRKRSGSRSRHHGGSSRRRRRSGDRHRRHRSHRSRSPGHRHRSSRHRSGRHRRSSSRERKRREMRKAQFAASLNRQPPQEDFKTKMKRELQQAARDAMSGKGTATPQQALLQTMAAMHAKAQELTGVEVPKFYNPAAINPLKFAEQQQKRKLLWSKAAQNKEHSLEKFQGTGVVADEKYRKLMGIKGDVQLKELSEEQKQKQSELFAKLDQEYAFARLATHTHRGMGLGVVSSFAAASANEQFNKP